MRTPTTTPIQVQTKDGRIHGHICKTWQHEMPEERVRQEYVCVLVNEYGFALKQMDEEKIAAKVEASFPERREP